MPEREHDSVESLFRTVRRQLLPRLLRSTVCVYRFKGPTVVLSRTGTLFAVGGEHFLITAAHKLREYQEKGVPLFLSVNEADSSLISLHGTLFTLTDRLVPDVAVIKLLPEIVQEIESYSGAFLQLIDIDQRTGASDGVYLILGFPGAWSRADTQTFSALPIPYVTSSFKGEMDSDFPFESWIHLSLEYELDAVNGVYGEHQQLPPVTGMSGCAIWRVGNDIEDVWNGSWDRSCKAVAVQHRWNQGRRYVIGTWMKHAMALIYHNFPELQPCFRIQYVG